MQGGRQAPRGKGLGLLSQGSDIQQTPKTSFPLGGCFRSSPSGSVSLRPASPSLPLTRPLLLTARVSPPLTPGPHMLAKLPSPEAPLDCSPLLQEARWTEVRREETQAGPASAQPRELPFPELSRFCRTWVAETFLKTNVSPREPGPSVP